MTERRRAAKKSPAEEATVVSVDGRDIVVTNPDKVLFPQAGHTKLDLVRYYLAVADGALRGAGGRPNVLVRYPNGIGGEFFYQKRAPESRPDWIEVVALQFPSGRTAEEVVPRDAAALAWMANLACLELHPHPVRADDLDHPDELRVDLDPVPGVAWDAGPRGRARRAARRSTTSGSSAGRRRRARAACTSTCASSGAGRSTRCAAPRWRWRARSSGARRRSPPASGGRKSATACSSTTTRTPRTARSPARTRCGRRRTRACRRRSPGTRSTSCEPADFTLATMPARFAAIGDRHAGIDRACRLARRAARAVRAPGARRAGRRAVAAALQEAARRAAARAAVAPARRRSIR